MAERSVKLTVLMPAYNAARYLREAMATVLAQTIASQVLTVSSVRIAKSRRQRTAHCVEPAKEHHHQSVD